MTVLPATTSGPYPDLIELDRRCRRETEWTTAILREETTARQWMG